MPNEALTPAGALRPHWARIAEWLDTAGPGALTEVSADLNRLRSESGLAYAASATRPVSDDMLPMTVEAADWAKLEAGILQRARLADAAVTDIYTDQRTLAAGLAPPGLVYGSPDFAAHCARWERPPRNWLGIYEADVARTADGNWVLLSDRIDAPLGDGWLLANRIAFSNAFADLFVDLGVRRLATHYAAFQDFLDQLMGWEGRLVLLTAGETDPRFFSHAYLARYMNAALVEPADLTVREGAAYVKTLGGLRRVDVLLRGVEDAAVDALHRPGRAAIGAPALSLAARSGNLRLINAIGAAAFNHRALAPFAHRLAQFLLGEDLLLPDAPCLWLGGQRARDQVAAEPETWTVEDLTKPPRTQVAERNAGDDAARTLFPERFCATRMPPLSVTPCLANGDVVAREWVMRVFACRTEDGWRLAPGGVAAPLVAGQRAAAPSLGYGKDVWVLADAEARQVPQITTRLTAQVSGAHLRRTGRDLLSRLADELFWLGRNAERAETVMRTVSVCLERHLSGNRVDADPAILAMLAEIHVETAGEDEGIARYRHAIDRLVAGDDPMSLPSILRALGSGALRARSSISVESARYVERLCSDGRWHQTGPVRQNAALARLIQDGLQALAAFAGSTQENLTRNYAWRFLQLGRLLERGVQTAALAEQLAGQTRENEQTYLRAWLTLSDSASAYRSRYMMMPMPAAVIDLLVLDETNPRALGYQLARLEDVLGGLPNEGPYRRADHRLALSMLTDLRLVDADALAAEDDDGARKDLVRLAQRAQEDLARISDLVAVAFFAHADAPEALVSHARAQETG